MNMLRTSLRWLFGYEGIPLMSRPTFRYDLLSNFFAAVGAAALMWQLTTQFARRALEATKTDLALLIAIAALGNFLTTFFAPYLSRLPRVKMVVASRILMAIFFGCVAMLPATPWSRIPFIFLLIPPYLVAAIILNIQTSVLHINYPDKLRGRIFSRQSIVLLATTAVVSQLASIALDELPWGHRLVYAVSAMAMLFSAGFYSRIRVRLERSMEKKERVRPPNPLAGFSLLRQDPAYGWFMAWQMLFGVANIMVLPIMTLVMTDYFKVNYAQGSTALVFGPLMVMILFAPLAGKLLDQVSITRYRAMGSALWGLCQISVAMGLLSSSWAWILVAAVIMGMAQGIGNMAYNLGHMYFTVPQRSHDYMGIHMTLQGIRGLLAPFLGIALMGSLKIGPIPVIFCAGLVQIGVGAGFFFMKPPIPAQNNNSPRNGLKEGVTQQKTMDSWKKTGIL